MKFTIKRYPCGYAEIIVVDGNASIASGLLSESEKKVMAEALRDAADELDPEGAP